MKKILLSLLSIAAVGVVAFGATTAFFTDTETSTGNIFESGSIDLKIDNTSYLNGVKQERLSWGLTNLVNELFFDFHDLKPGDEGEDTVSLHVYDNDAWACVDLRITANDDSTDEPLDIDCTEPELEPGADPTCDLPTPEPDVDFFDGELAGELNFIFWVDDGDNVLEEHERDNILTGGPASAVLGGVSWTLADSSGSVFDPADLSTDPLTLGALIGSHDYFIGKAWCYGSLTPDPVVRDPLNQTTPADGPSGVLCDGTGVSNASQTDMLKGDIVFRAEQARNNESFTCLPL